MGMYGVRAVRLYGVSWVVHAVWRYEAGVTMRVRCMAVWEGIVASPYDVKVGINAWFRASEHNVTICNASWYHSTVMARTARVEFRNSEWDRFRFLPGESLKPSCVP